MRFSKWCFFQCNKNKLKFEKSEDNVKETSEEKGSRVLQFASAICLSFSILGVGEAIAWTSPALTYLTSQESEIPIKMEQRAWMASINSIGTIIGYLMISLFMDRLGRKYAMMIYAIPQCISWIIIIFGKNFTVLCIARVITGWGYAGALSLTTVYLAEITDKEVRGMLTVFLILSADAGIFIVGLTGAYLSYQNMNLVLLIPSVFCLISLPFIPESPYFYFMKNREEEGVKTLMKLRGMKRPESVMTEVNEIRKLTRQFQENKKCNFMEMFSSRSNRKALLIVSFGHLTFVLSGSIVLLTYTQEIFGYSGFSLSPAHSAALLAGVKTISGLVATQMIDKAGRRFFFLLSGVSCGISLMFVGMFFFLKFQMKMDVSGITWMPLVGLLGFEIASPLGISTVPHILCGELFPIKVKQSAVVFVYLITPLLTFGTKLMFPLLNDAAGIHTTFWTFAACCLIGTFVVFFNAPETRGKSLDEIQSILNKQ